MDINAFISKNKDKYKIIIYFQELLNQITAESFPKVVEYIEDHQEFFFKDRESALLFLWNTAFFTLHNFKHFNLILDLIIHYSKEIKQAGIDEYDIIDINLNSTCNINYLYDHNIISIQSIFKKSIHNSRYFVNFYPEIYEYDQEYSEKLRDSILNDQDNDLFDKRIVSFMKLVVSDQEKHKENRSKNFNCSSLHQSIRDDDIDTFQKILSRNNYSINYHFEYSFYERAQTENLTPSLIQVAAIYGSLNIFKFLFMQSEIQIEENLIDYAISGRNLEIIHLCETKCPLERSLTFSIASHQNELSEYIIERSSQKVENLNEENIYSNLEYKGLKCALESANYDVILPCLEKIISIIQNCENYNELEKEDGYGDNSFFSIQFYDMELFKFFYSYKNPKFDFFGGLNPVFFYWITNNMYDVIEYLMPFLEPCQLFQIYEDSLRFNSKICCLLLDYQFDEIENKSEHPVFDEFKKYFDDSFLFYTLSYFVEEVIVKEYNLYRVIDDPEAFLELILHTEAPSKKMLNSFFKNKFNFASKETVLLTSQLLRDQKLDDCAASILEYNQ